MKMRRSLISCLTVTMLFSVGSVSYASNDALLSNAEGSEHASKEVTLSNDTDQTLENGLNGIDSTGIDLSNVVDSTFQEKDVMALDNELSIEATNVAPVTKSTMSRHAAPNDYVLSKSFLENINAVKGITTFSGGNEIKNNDTTGTSRAVGNNSPDKAIFLDETYYDQPLNDNIIGDGVPNWYYVYAPTTSKINFYLSQATNQDSDVYVYSLNQSTGVLSLVDYSINDGQLSESIGYMAEAGYYFFRIEPNGTTNSNNYTFLTNVNNTYDQYEKNDSPNDNLSLFTGKMDVNANIDFMFDSDWYLFKPSSAGKHYVSLNNVPSDAQYAFYIYNENLGSMGSFLSSGNESRWLELESNKSYYIRVESYDGKYTPQSPYNVTVVKAPPTPPSITAGTYDVYVNGQAINLSWEYQYASKPYNGYYSRNESTMLNRNGTSTIGNVYKGTFRGFNKTIQNALLIEANYVGFYDYMYRFGNTTAPSGEPTRNQWHYSDGVYANIGTFIYNIDTGKIEDNLGSYPYSYRGEDWNFKATEQIKSR
ncbi:hypothetical protein GY31_11645 [Lysinibacillus sphaericus]|uniref:hypothetical protein n=1 Tax=Lysinibacillus TaxID=400634 RepID=UPI00084AF3C1|nr:hypothetical protein [Lysinibacillus sphaericus]OEC02008.1 hypothetical protein GY31_11645 [Lysinibacillus sphaericus]